ncbi:hypothetical protein MO329_19965 [Xanthomonas translucens]|nr:hypothetical protein [Xanthomonas translucens]WLA04796.1 hypothetical protein MO329_19965 [Xanthomonas translucens]
MSMTHGAFASALVDIARVAALPVVSAPASASKSAHDCHRTFCLSVRMTDLRSRKGTRLWRLHGRDDNEPVQAAKSLRPAPPRHIVLRGQQRALPLQQQQGFAIVAQADAQARDHALQFGTRQGLPQQLAFAALLAAGEQTAQVEAVAALRIAGAIEQADHEILHGLRAHGLALRLAHLPQRHARGTEQRGRGHAAEHRAPAVSLQVFLQAADQALRARLHRPPLQIAAQVLGQRLGRIALPLLRGARHCRRRPRRLHRQDRALPLGVAAAAQGVGLLVGEQFIQHHAQRIHIGQRGDRFAAHLLRRGVVQGERAHFGARMRIGCGAGLDSEQLGDAEVEPAHLACGVDQDVGRLQVAMYDQVGVGVTDHLAYLQEQPQPRAHRQLQALAMIGERLAFDIGQRQVRVLQPRQDLALAGEALAQRGVGVAGTQQFQRDLALVQAVDALRQPDLAHAAFAEQPLQRIRPGPATGAQALR